jgi:hypothetical protein
LRHRSGGYSEGEIERPRSCTGPGEIDPRRVPQIRDLFLDEIGQISKVVRQ